MLRNPLGRNGQRESSTSLLIQGHGIPAPDNDGRQEDKSVWPDHPRMLARSGTDWMIEISALLPLIAIPAAFITLAVFISRLDNQPISSHGQTVRDIAGVGSTLWPIAFAAVIGALVRTIALFKAEKGTTLGTLELLLGSQTLMNTLHGLYTLRVYSLWTVFLLALWTMSPIGGQAVLRTIGTKSHTEAQDYDLIYSPSANIGPPLDYGTWESGSALATYFGHIQSLFSAALSAPNSLGQVSNGSSPYFDTAVSQLGGAARASIMAREDLWGNVRVPEIASLPGYSTEDPHRWVDVPADQLVNYESLVGIPIRGAPSESPGKLTLPLSAAYVTLECSPWFDTKPWLLETPDALRIHKNLTQEGIKSATSGVLAGGNAHVFMDIPNVSAGYNFSSTNTTGKGRVERGTFVFGSLFGGDGNSTICDISHIYVDVNVECERLQKLDRMNCSATSMRHSEGYPFPMPDTQLLALNGSGPGNFFSYLPWLARSYHSSNLSPFENYLADPARGSSWQEDITTSEGITDHYTKLPLPVFAQRLALVINTGLRVSYYTPTIQAFSNVNLTQMERFGREYSNTTGSFVITEKRYKIQNTWMVFHIISLAVMGLCVLATVYLRCLIRAPDFLTNVSALTRDSAYINVPAGGSTLCGEDRARMLKDRRLRIRDVQPEQGVGYIALADDVGSLATKRLDVDGRLYT